MNEYQEPDSLKEYEAIQKRNAAVIAHQDSYIKELIEAAVLAEREACAKVCEAEARASGDDYEAGGMFECAAVIRARGKK